MKRILTFFLVAFSTYAIAQDKDAGFIGGKNTFYGTVTDQEVTIDYRAKVKYSATLFGGIKVNATITEFVFWNVRYKGKKMSNAVYDELGIGDKDGYIKPNKQSQFDFTTDVEFYTHITNDIMIRDIKFVAVGWGTLDEYTYLKKEKVKDIKIFFNLTKENIKDFYKLNMKFYNLEITSFTISIIQDIKNAMDKETAGEKELERKLAALQKLQPDADLTVSQLNRKVSLLNDVTDKGYTDCYGYHTCQRALANAQAEIEERKEKGEKEDEKEKEAVAEKKEDTQDKEKDTEEQQRLAQEQKQKQAEAKRKATEAKKKAEQKRLAEAERKRKEEANRKAEEGKNREWDETVKFLEENISDLNIRGDNGAKEYSIKSGKIIVTVYDKNGELYEVQEVRFEDILRIDLKYDDDRYVSPFYINIYTGGKRILIIDHKYGTDDWYNWIDLCCADEVKTKKIVKVLNHFLKLVKEKRENGN